MIDLPAKCVARDLQPLADWVELCAIVGPPGEVSQVDVYRMLGEEESYRDSYRDDPLAPEDDVMLALAEDVWSLLSARESLLGRAYPFTVDDDLLLRSRKSWRDTPSYTAMLLIASLLQYPPDIQVCSVDGFTFRQLFEKIVQASGRGLFGGPSVRFGVPPEPGWPTGFRERVKKLADEMALDLGNIDAQTHSREQDRTLDVCSRLSFGDDGPGSIAVLTQCATGKNWKDKRGEPSLAEWRSMFVWEEQLVRSIAVPLWIGKRREYGSLHRHFDAMILDRPRLLSGRPDRFLDKAARKSVRQWCEAQIKRLPTLD